VGGQLPDVLEVLGLSKGDEAIDALDEEAVGDELEMLAHDALHQFERQTHNFLCVGEGERVGEWFARASKLFDTN
jgi:hypothetical protein